MTAPEKLSADQVAEIVDQALRSERARILAILQSPACEGRFDLVHHLAFMTGTPWCEAIAILEVAGTSEEPLPACETEAERCARIRRVGELVGREQLAEELVEKTAVPSYFAATLLAADTDGHSD